MKPTTKKKATSPKKPTKKKSYWRELADTFEAAFGKNHGIKPIGIHE